MDGGLFKKEKPITLSLIIFTFLCFLFFSTNAQALVYCVGCSGATAGTCTGGVACGAPCNTGTNGVVCPTIAAALTCINNNNDLNATIRLAQNSPMMPYTGPGSSNVINNTESAAQTINILGGWTATTCATQTVNPTNTIVEAPMDDRVFLINNTTNFALDVTLEGLTITGGDPMPNCDGVNGGGVCVTSSSGTGGVIFTSSTNIYDDNMANASGGGLAVITQVGGNIMATTTDDTFTNNSATSLGGAMLFLSDGETLDATISGDIIGGDSPFPLGGNESAADGGGIVIVGTDDGELNVTSQGNLIKSNSSDGGGGRWGFDH